MSLEDAPLVTVDGLSARPCAPGFRGPLLLDGVDLAVRRGELVCVFGRSGSGKTTLARCIAGPDPGRLHIVDGRVVHATGRRRITLQAPPAELSARRRDAVRRRLDREMRPLRGRHVYVVFQNSATALDPHHPVGEGLRRAASADADVGRLDRALAACGVSDPRRVLRAYPFELSGGQCRCVALSAAVLSRAPLLVVDEPTTGLDPHLRLRVVDLLLRLRDRGRGVLVISHALPEFAGIADRVHLLDAGRQVYRGSGARLLDAPDTLDPRARALVRAAIDPNFAPARRDRP